MNTASFHIYSDASFSKDNQVGVAGFLLFSNDADHGIPAASDAPRTKVFGENNNIRAELRAVLFACEGLIDELDRGAPRGVAGDVDINLYTDCQSVARLPGRRHRLEASGFVSAKTGKELPNADLYRRFYAVCDRLNPKIVRVKGHSPRQGRDLVQSHFSLIDKAVRKELRGVCARLDVSR